ncbi:putative B3 domain-containing protein Os06g0632500 [Typha angustifolia]|uniref:putative B3 domain-containing protein Os06g0632500 n=1 Tax=Typha angustifolia TaxID=59011 RepID=UPI003C2E0011
MDRIRSKFFKVYLPPSFDTMVIISFSPLSPSSPSNLTRTLLSLQKIPSEFTHEHLRTEHGGKAMLLITTLAVFWHVTLHRDGSDIYFAGGWPEFARAHELLAGYFVVFCHEGNLVFTVEVFDLTGCKKYYPTWNYAAKPMIELDDDSTDNDGMPSPSSCSTKKKKQETTCKKRAIEGRPPSPILVPKKEGRKISCVDPVPQLEKILRPYNFNHKYMSISKGFCTRHGLLKKAEMVFKNSEGRSWPVKFFPGNEESHFGKGWDKFSSDNKLKEGDKCVFQLVAKDEMNVQIVRK